LSRGSTPLLINPTSGAGRGERVLNRLRGVTGVEARTTSGPDDLREQLAAIAREGAARVIVAGGDGTLHQAIQTLSGSGCALGIVPTGSGNDLARALGVPLDPLQATHRALEATPRTIDLGRVGERWFAGVAGVGFDGEVARLAHERFGQRRGRWIYPYAVLRTLLSFRPPHASIEYDGGRFEGSVMLVALANTPCYGGGMRIAPRAKIDDGWLDLVIIRRVSRLRLLAVFPRVYRGRHVTDPAIEFHRVRSAVVRVDRPLTFFGDGEPLASCGAEGREITVHPGALTVAV